MKPIRDQHVEHYEVSRWIDNNLKLLNGKEGHEDTPLSLMHQEKLAESCVKGKYETMNEQKTW